MLQVHLLIDCSAMTQFRNSCDLGSFISAYRKTSPQISSLKLYALFLNDSNPDLLKKRAMSLYTMQLAWHQLMNINMY